jgi:hypothetical protein
VLDRIRALKCVIGKRRTAAMLGKNNGAAAAGTAARE